MAHNRPEDMPPDAERLTIHQYELLSVVFIKGFSQSGEIVPVVWSPTKIIGKSLTRGEASTISTRLKTLIQRGFIKRYGNELFVTEWGRYALWAYASKNQNEGLALRIVLNALDFYEAREEVKAFKKVLAVMKTRQLPPENRVTILYTLGNELGAAILRENMAYNELMEIRKKIQVERESN